MSLRLALKEWASVVEAFGDGRQLVLIRKGGLIEPGSGFELQGDEFLFYPTYEHQTVNFVREEFRSQWDAALGRKPSDDRAGTVPAGEGVSSAAGPTARTLRIGCYGRAVYSKQVTDPSVIKRLEPFHLYNDAFLQQRLKWQPEQPLVVVVVRAFRLPQVHALPAAPHYAGCKSWVELDAPVPLDGAQPALADGAFDERLQTIRSILL